MSSPFEDGVIHVDYNHVNNAVENMVQQTKAIEQTLTNLEAELGALRESWEGEDKESYTRCQNDWNQAVVGMENLLKSHVELLNRTQHNYRYTEQKLASMWNSVKVQP